MILFNGDQTPGRENLLSAAQILLYVSKDRSASFFSADIFYEQTETKFLWHRIWKTHLKCVISGFRRQSDETCALPRPYAAYSGNSLPTFRDNLSELSSRVKTAGKNCTPYLRGAYLVFPAVFFSISTVHGGTDRLFQNVRYELPLYAAKCPRRAQISHFKYLLLKNSLYFQVFKKAEQTH